MISERITASKIYAKLTQETLSKAVSVGKRTLADYEKGVSEPKATTIVNIAEICKVDITWLLTGQGDMLLKEDSPPKTETNLSDAEQELLDKFRKLPAPLKVIHIEEIDNDLRIEATKEKRKQHQNNPLEAPNETNATA